ncbi:MAG: hypothetical protein VZQ98_19100, partial [Bacteroidales bacterium]|nr:hypothetical protein [Bacteroidales bacterium]
CDEKDVPLELKLNLDNLDYFRNISSRAVAQTKLLMSSVDNDLKGIASDEDIKLLKSFSMEDIDTQTILGFVLTKQVCMLK